jgi:hypothetical protein
MKNIYVLPTDKPSRLVLDDTTQNLILINKGEALWGNQHIYITSDDSEIKDVDWYLDTTVNEIFKNDKIFLNGFGYKKIILTTDPLLAPDVRKIDDEFLEWFVKNPNCEEVEVGYGWIRLTETDNEGYWVSIPDKQFEMQQEEPKQETVGKQFYESADKVITVNKQETLEEFIESQPYYGSCTTEYLEGIEVGAKWQAQRRYSEEEVKHIVSEALQSALVKVDLEQWFKQFKKK